MYAQIEKPKENKSKEVANTVTQKKSAGKQGFGSVDNRPEAIAQRKLQEIANNSPQAMQLRVFQTMVNNSPQAKQAAQLQAMPDNYSAQQHYPIQKKENNTGLPDNLKLGIENLSGYSMDDVKVHYNSDKPAQLQAHAYAQGTDIHLAQGQKKHLPHEAWHVVQQKQGRVPTMQMKGTMNINDDAELEKEADVMGAKAFQLRRIEPTKLQSGNTDSKVVQGYSIVQAGNLRAQQHATIETQDLAQTRYGSTYVNSTTTATQQGVNPTTSVRTTEKVSGAHQQVTSNLPAFKVSQNALMAVPDYGQAKNFYATRGIITAANAAFVAGGTDLRLVSQGHSITVPLNPATPVAHQTRNLKKVHAALRVPVGAHGAIQTQIQHVFPVMECNAFIRLITGISAAASRMAVLEDTAQAAPRREVQASERWEPTEGIATHMSGGAPQSATQVGNALAGPALTGAQVNAGLTAYETLPDLTRSVRSAKLGVNEHVDPQVGEGMVIKSMATTNLMNPPAYLYDAQNMVASGTNSRLKQAVIKAAYTNALHRLDAANAIVSESRATVSARIQEMMKTWAVHYAGVVGRDGPDMVTLENYNRVVEVRWEHQRIFNNLFRDFQEFKDLVGDRLNHLRAVPSQQDIQLLVAAASAAPGLGVAYQAALAEATQSFATGLKNTAATFGGAFYFDMYGPAAQSFHAKFKGTASNPLTLHIKEDVQAVAQDATAEILRLHNRIQLWETPILAHPIAGFGVNAGYMAVINHALTEEAACNVDFAAANTRAEYKAVRDRANRELWTVFNTQIRARVMAAYQAIIGRAPVPLAANLADLVVRCNAFRNTYYFFNKADAEYNQITNLRNLVQALIAVGL